MIVRICGLVSGYAGRQASQTPETPDIIRIADFPPAFVEKCEQPRESVGQNFVSPINGQTDSNLKNPKVICLEETGFADMYSSLAGKLVKQCVRLENGCDAASEKFDGREMSQADV
jgi:hypothetical protein